MDQYKTITIEDTELIYTILREKYPNNQIDIQYNYNTKEYTLSKSELPYKDEPDVPLNITINVIYGDSVLKDTPILLRDPTTKQIHIKTIESICDTTEFVEYPKFKLFDQSIRLKKMYALTNYEVWSDKGWNPIKKVIKHKTNKKLYRVLTHTGCVDVTEDHSLCDNKGEKVKPSEVRIGDALLHNFPLNCIKDDLYLLYSSSKYENCTGFLNQTKLKAAELYYYFFYIWSGNIKLTISNNNSDYIYNIIKCDNENTNKIIKILEEKGSVLIDDFVYDLETEFGKFQAGIGQMIVFNTDSIFISVKFNRNDYEQNRKDSFKLAISCGDNITKMFNRNPINLEFEKVYQPFVLLTKKRYIGKKFEDTRDPMKLKTLTTSGIAITKRNYSNIVKKCYREVIDVIMDTSDLEQAIEIYKGYIDRIDNYQINQEDLVVSAQIGKEYSCKTCKKKTEWIIKCDKCKTLNPKMTPTCQGQYKNGLCNKKFECLHTFSLGHINLAQRFLLRNEEICVGDRIQFIYVESDNKTAAKAELTEDPNYAKLNNIKFNRGCYLEQLAKSVLGFFKVVLKDQEDLIDDLLEFTNEKLVEYGSSKLKISDFKITDNDD